MPASAGAAASAFGCEVSFLWSLLIIDEPNLLANPPTAEPATEPAAPPPAFSTAACVAAEATSPAAVLTPASIPASTASENPGTAATCVPSSVVHCGPPIVICNADLSG